MSKVYTISDQSRAHFITATVVDWVDVFTRKIYRDIIVENLKYYSKNRGLIVYAYVVMSNHVINTQKVSTITSYIRYVKCCAKSGDFAQQVLHPYKKIISPQLKLKLELPISGKMSMNFKH